MRDQRKANKDINVKVSPLLSKVVGVKEKVSFTLISEIVPEIVGG